MTTTTNMINTTRFDIKPSIGSIFRAGAIGIVIAAVLNAILYFLSAAIGALPIMSTMGQPITLVPVLSFTIGSGIGATILYLILTRFLDHHRAILRLKWKPEFLPQTKTPVSIQSGV